MDILKANYIDTTTSIVVGSATDTALYLFDRDPSFQYVTAGFNNDLTTASIRINFSETMTVSRIALVEHNLKAFTLFYNGTTASTFALSTSSSTISSAFTTNSETAQYLEVTPVFCTSVTLDMKSTQTADQEKAVGYMVISDIHIAFSRPPSAKGYKIKLDPFDVQHKLSDGGVRIQNIADNYMVTLDYDFLSESTRNTLYDIFKLHRELVFCPFGTTTSWDKVIFPCVWSGNFEFFEFSDNAAGAGFSGKITLSETPR